MYILKKNTVFPNPYTRCTQSLVLEDPNPACFRSPSSNTPDWNDQNRKLRLLRACRSFECYVRGGRHLKQAGSSRALQDWTWAPPARHSLLPIPSYLRPSSPFVFRIFQSPTKLLFTLNVERYMVFFFLSFDKTHTSFPQKKKDVKCQNVSSIPKKWIF